jgi:hypothetical protein
MNAPISPRSGAEPDWQLHRARHLAGLCHARSVHLAGAVGNATRHALSDIADLVDSSAEIVLSLAALPAREALAALPALVSRCDSGKAAVSDPSLCGHAARAAGPGFA